jgi:hypothetical protein
MKTYRIGIAAGLAALACPLWADAPVQVGVSREVLVGYAYQPQPASRTQSSQPTDGVTRMPAMQVVAPRNTTYRDVKAAVAGSDLLAPCMLYTNDLPSGKQLQALGAPLMPWRDDTTGTRLQARFPLVSLAF